LDRLVFSLLPATIINPRIPDPSSRKLEGSGVGVGETVELNVAVSLKVSKSACLAEIVGGFRFRKPSKRVI
jgi:hypothetical protein